jgi:hypothetical protein
MGDESRAGARGESGEVVHSHTEFTRLVSEHGLMGAAALVLMLMMSARSVIRQSRGWPMAFSASLVVFALIFMTGSGMRLAIPSFLLAFAGVRICRPRLGRMKVQRRTGLPAMKSIRNPFPRIFPRLGVRRKIGHSLFKAKTKP